MRATVLGDDRSGTFVIRTYGGAMHRALAHLEEASTPFTAGHMPGT